MTHFLAIAHYFETYYSHIIPLMGMLLSYSFPIHFLNNSSFVNVTGGIDNIAKQLLANPIGSLGFVHTDKYDFRFKLLIHCNNESFHFISLIEKGLMLEVEYY